MNRAKCTLLAAHALVGYSFQCMHVEHVHWHHWWIHRPFKMLHSRLGHLLRGLDDFDGSRLTGGPQVVRTTAGGSDEEISFRVKSILAFQRIAGADVIIFGMYVLT